MSDQNTTDLSTEESVSLVPIDDSGLVAVFAASPDRARAVLADLRPGSSSGDIATATFDRSVDALGLAGTGAAGASQAVAALSSLQGVVQLAPDTMALLNSGHQLMTAADTGRHLGTVVTSGGKIVGNAQFVPLSNAVTVGTVAASLGPAIALAAIQFQLNRLENLLGEVKRLTQTLLDESRTQRWSAVEARIDRVNRELGWVIEMGTVPARLVDHLAGDAVDLHTFALATTELLTSRMGDLSGKIGAKDKRHQLEQSAQAIARDAVDLSLAADAWLAVETLRSFHLRQDEDAATRAYGERVYSHALTTSETWRAEAGVALTDVQRLLSRIAAQEPHALRRHERRSTSLARAVSRALSSALPDLEPARLVPPAGTPGLQPEVVEPVLQESRWVLAGASEVHALVGVSIDGAPGFRLETSRQVLIAETDRFLRTGEATVITDLENADDAVTAAGVDLSYDEPEAAVVRQGKRAVAQVASIADRAHALRRRNLATEIPDDREVPRVGR